VSSPVFCEYFCTRSLVGQPSGDKIKSDVPKEKNTADNIYIYIYIYIYISAGHERRLVLSPFHVFLSLRNDGLSGVKHFSGANLWPAAVNAVQARPFHL